jgi:hypothetical protein
LFEVGAWEDRVRLNVAGRAIDDDSDSEEAAAASVLAVATDGAGDPRGETDVKPSSSTDFIRRGELFCLGAASAGLETEEATVSEVLEAAAAMEHRPLNFALLIEWIQSEFQIKIKSISNQYQIGFSWIGLWNSAVFQLQMILL